MKLYFPDKLRVFLTAISFSIVFFTVRKVNTTEPSIPFSSSCVHPPFLFISLYEFKANCKPRNVIKSKGKTSLFAAMDNENRQSYFKNEFLLYSELRGIQRRRSSLTLLRKRVLQVVNEENERIMQEMRSNGTIYMCPLCFDESPAI